MNKDNSQENNVGGENVKEMGVPNIPDLENPIQFLTIIGEIEGHNLSSSDKKNH